jgi:hypothetical protein
VRDLQSVAPKLSGHRLPRCLVVALTLLTATACTEEQSTEPNSTPRAALATETCGAECVLVNDAAPFLAARFNADSAGIPVPIGIVEVSGNAGARISLALIADLEVLRTMGQNVRLLVEVDGGTEAYSIADLRRGVTAYTFDRAGQVRLRYSLERRVTAAAPDLQVRVVQRLSGDATVAAIQRRWIAAAGPALAMQSVLTCQITGEITTGCDNTVTTTPYVATSFLGATFQSDPGTGQSHPIAISFARPVKAVTIRIVDSDCPGNQMIASDAGGTVGALSFSYDNQPGNDAINETRTITAPAGRSITRVDLIPDPCEYVAYSGSWEALPLTLNVACLPAPVVRGQSVTCTASATDPNVPITVSEWRFDSPDLSGPIVETSSATVWSGTAAAGGVVHVTGTLDGAQAMGDGQLTVAARNWSQDTVAYRLTEVIPSGLPIRPKVPGELGNHAGDAQGYLPPGGFPQVTSGPNQGVFYFTRVPVAAKSDIRINRVALSLNSDFYLRQPKSVPSGSTKCAQADVLPFLPKAENHEGLTLASNSHAGTWRRELNARVPQATENVVALNDVSLLQAKAQTAAQPGIQAALANSRDQINGGTVPPIVHCTFRYF